MPVSDNINKFDRLFRKGKYKELLEYSLTQDGVEARYWEMYTLFYLGRCSKCRKKYLEYEHNYDTDIWKAKFLHIKGLIHWGHGNQQAIEYLLNALDIAVKIDYKEGMVDNYNAIGAVMIEQNNEDGFEYREKAYELANQIDYKIGKIRTIRGIGVDLIYKSKYEEGFENIKKAMELAEKIDHDDELTYSLLWMGRYYTRIKELDKASVYLEHCNNLAIQLDNWWSIANSLANIALIDRFRGDLDLSLNKCTKRHDIELKIGIKIRIAWALSRIAEIYEEQGELDKALDNYNYSLEVNEEEGILTTISQNLLSIGNIYKMKGDYEAALSYFERGYQKGHEIGSPICIQSPLYNLVSLLASTDRERAKIYLDEFEEIEAKANIVPISDAFKFTRAIFLKSSIRLIDKMQALVLFKEIFDEKVSQGISIMHCIPHLLELLIIEYELSKEKEVLDEIKEYLDLLYNTAIEENLYPYLIKALLIKSQLSQIGGEFNKSEELVEEAISIAKEKNLGALLREVEIVQEGMRSEIERMQHLLNKNADFTERLKHSNLMNYLKKAQESMKSGISE